MKKLTALLFATFIICSLNAQLLWKVSGNGLSQPSYLMGTHHLAPLSLLASIAGYPAAIAPTKQITAQLTLTPVQHP